jgi:DNA-binding transcriptional LysR family regulator
VLIRVDGDVLVQVAQVGIRKLRVGGTRLRSSEMEPSAKLMVGSYESIAIRIWPHFVRIIAKKYPGISISLKTDCDGEMFQKLLLASTLDLVVTISSRNHPQLTKRKLCTDSFGVYAAPELLRAKLVAASASIADLHRVPLVLVPTAQTGDGQTLERLAWENHFVGRQQIYELDSFEAAKEFMIEGIGVGLLPKWVATASVRNGSLRELKLKDVPAGKPLGVHSLYATFRKEDHADSSLQALVTEAEALLNPQSSGKRYGSPPLAKNLK